MLYKYRNTETNIQSIYNNNSIDNIYKEILLFF